jgi:hypothetical protein
MTKLLIWKCYHALMHMHRTYKQNDTIKILAPLVVPISGSAHGRNWFCLLAVAKAELFGIVCIRKGFEHSTFDCKYVSVMLIVLSIY